MQKLIVNVALFQTGWLVCVFGGDRYALAFTGLVLLLHKWLVLESRAEWKLIAIVALCGALWDMLMVNVGVISYADASIFGIPLWLVCLWIIFATTFMHSLCWLHRHFGLAALLGAILGPASYWLGSQLTDAQFGLPLLTSLTLMALGWALLFPCAMRYAGKLKA